MIKKLINIFKRDKLKYHYLVSYHFKNDKGTGFGAIDFDSNRSKFYITKDVYAQIKDKALKKNGLIMDEVLILCICSIGGYSK